jgi:hypothetical protein
VRGVVPRSIPFGKLQNALIKRAEAYLSPRPLFKPIESRYMGIVEESNEWEFFEFRCDLFTFHLLRTLTPEIVRIVYQTLNEMQHNLVELSIANTNCHPGIRTY